MCTLQVPYRTRHESALSPWRHHRSAFQKGPDMLSTRSDPCRRLYIAETLKVFVCVRIEKLTDCPPGPPYCSLGSDWVDELIKQTDNIDIQSFIRARHHYQCQRSGLLVCSENFRPVTVTDTTLFSQLRVLASCVLGIATHIPPVAQGCVGDMHFRGPFWQT